MPKENDLKLRKALYRAFNIYDDLLSSADEAKAAANGNCFAALAIRLKSDRKTFAVLLATIAEIDALDPSLLAVEPAVDTSGWTSQQSIDYMLSGIDEQKALVEQLTARFPMPAVKGPPKKDRPIKVRLRLPFDSTDDTIEASISFWPTFIEIVGDVGAESHLNYEGEAVLHKTS